MSDRMRELAVAVRTFLLTREYFSDAAAPEPKPMMIVLKYDKQSQSMLDVAIGKDQGLCLYLQTPGGKVEHPDIPGPVYDPAHLVVSVYENPDVNESPLGFNESAETVADAVIRTLHLQTLPGFEAPLTSLGRIPMEDPEYGRIDCPFTTTVPLDPAEPHRAAQVTRARLVDGDGAPLVDEAGNPFTE